MTRKTELPDPRELSHLSGLSTGVQPRVPELQEMLSGNYRRPPSGLTVPPLGQRGRSSPLQGSRGS